MLTVGNENKTAFRVTMGRLSRRGRFHRWQPCVFWIFNGKRTRWAERPIQLARRGDGQDAD